MRPGVSEVSDIGSRSPPEGTIPNFQLRPVGIGSRQGCSLIGGMSLGGFENDRRGPTSRRAFRPVPQPEVVGAVLAVVRRRCNTSKTLRVHFTGVCLSASEGRGK